MMDIKSKLLDEILNCPDVEWFTVDDIFSLKNGYTPSKSKIEYWSNGDIPWFRMEDLRLNGGILDTAIQHVHESGIKGELFPANSIIMATTATIGIHALITKEHLSNQQFTNFTVKEKYKSLLNIKFVYYYFFILDEKAKKSVNTSSFACVQMNQVRKWDFPIPPLPIQQKIVDILDKFTELTAELTAELIARKQQYEYYRDELLTFGDDVEYKGLGEIANIETGHKPKEILETQTIFDYINAGTSRSGYSADGNCEGDTVTTPSRGQGGIGYVGYQPNPFWLGPLCYKIQSKNNNLIINKYLFYFLQSNNKLLLGLKKEGGVPAINKSDLAKLIIIYPTLIEQIKIVKILDKFDTLTNSITEGLPREIELRQQQYEYYRDLLLSFPKPDGVK